MAEPPDKSTSELEHLRAESDRLRQERDVARSDLKALEDRAESVASAQLQLLASKLSNEIKADFWNTVKQGLWIAALLASVATGGERRGSATTLPPPWKSSCLAALKTTT